MKKKLFVLIQLGVCTLAASCGEEKKTLSPDSVSAAVSESPLFTLLDSSQSGFFCWNEVKETEANNVLTYENYLNGAGVAIGDINGDSLPDIYMCGNYFGGRLFLNLGGMKFRQISETSGTFSEGFSTGATFADINGDGLDDIYLCRSLASNRETRRNLLFINNGNLTFTNRAKEYGLDDPGFSNHASFLDYDRDGDLDMFLVNHRIDFNNALLLTPAEVRDQELKRIASSQDTVYRNHSNKLYRNNGNGTFTDVTVQAGVVSHDFGLSATVSDLNQDGWPDLYVCSDYAALDHLYINQKNGSFRDELSQRVGCNSRNSMGSDIADFNNDGYPDIITLDMMAEDNYRQKQLKGNTPWDLFQTATSHGYGYQVMRNCLQLNRGDGRFSEISMLAGVSNTDWSWSPLFADFDNDGFQDLFITNGLARDITDMDFTSYTSPALVKQGGGPDKVKPLDLVKQVPSTAIPNYIFRNAGDLTFEKKSAEWGLNQNSFSNGSAYADFDRDGDIDLIVNNFNQPAFLYRNEARELRKDHHFLTVKISGEKGNPHGYGTMLRLVTDQGVQYREIQPGRGFLSCSEPLAHFGTGKQSTVKQLIIRWPDGVQRVIENPAVDRIHWITKESGNPYQSPEIKNAAMFTSATGIISPDPGHQQPPYIDFKVEPLLDAMPSRQGPFMCRADFNGDNQEDFYAGGYAGVPGRVYLQDGAGAFRSSARVALAVPERKQEGHSAPFDADGDGDTDLAVTLSEIGEGVPPGNAWALLINDGKGNFSGAPAAAWTENAWTIEALDYDADGDKDLFIGGYAKPGMCPNASLSVIMKNDKGAFTPVKAFPREGDLGMVNDAVAVDLNGDRREDLVTAGWWNTIKVYISMNDGSFEDQTEKYGLGQSGGYWNSLEIADLDKDGDQDIIAGNRGLNQFWHPSPDKPAILSFSDLDNNGEGEGMISYHFSDGQLHPKNSLDELAVRVPGIKSRFPEYKKYSLASTMQVVGEDKWSTAPKWYIHGLESVVFMNQGSTFSRSVLPVEAQMFPVKGIASADVNEDGFPDLLLTGNEYDASTDIGRMDAGYGCVLISDGGKSWKAQPALQSGFYLQGNTRDVIWLQSRTGHTAIVSTQNGPLQAFRHSHSGSAKLP